MDERQRNFDVGDIVRPVAHAVIGYVSKVEKPGEYFAYSIDTFKDAPIKLAWYGANELLLIKRSPVRSYRKRYGKSS